MQSKLASSVYHMSLYGKPVPVQYRQVPISDIINHTDYTVVSYSKLQ